MSNQVLYRKYRPATFAQVVGQEHIVPALERQIKNGTHAHAYLFYGGRGTGKTSLARIIAKDLGATAKDIYEIDAASNTGVEDVRLLREGATSLPFESKVKVYIIDEVHMLSKAAFNALLKTLEEPPAHVVFILATTEIHKVPDTVISRCEFYTFKKPTTDILRPLIKKVVEAEGLTIEEEAVGLVASLGDGSYRDMLGVLQKVLSGSKAKNIKVADVTNLAGLSKNAQIKNFISSLLDADDDKTLSFIVDFSKSGGDMAVFLKQVLETLRLSMLIKYSPDLKTEITNQVGKDELKNLEEIAGHKNSDKLSAILKELLEAKETAGTGFLPSLSLEIAVVNICHKLK